MTRSRFQRHLFVRATAWLLILVCAWMGTDGVLHHTDAGPFSHAAASLHGATTPAAADTCAACQWTDGMQSGTLTVCRVPCPLFALNPCVLPPVCRLSRRVSRPHSSRAPPALVTC